MLEQGLILIGSAALLVPLLQRLGLGSILGYLVAGMVVGPYGLSLIHSAEAIQPVAELGVVLLLFMIGLEMQPRKLWSMRKLLFGLGGAQILVSSIVFFFAGKMVGLSNVPSAVLGFSLSLSSTAFSLQSLQERDLLATDFGAASFAILLSQDLSAIPALAIIPRLSSAAFTIDSGSSVGTNVLTLVVIVVVVFASRSLIRPVFRFIASTRSREVFTATTLFLVLGVAALMERAGLAASLGTFLAGVILADSEYRHELESDLDPFKSLLMGLFFIAVGMGVNTDLVRESPGIIVLATMGYLLIKGLILYLVARAFRFSHGGALQMGLTLAQGGEFAFVIFNISHDWQAAPDHLLGILSVVITASMLLSPVIIFLGQRWLSYRSRRQPEGAYDRIENESPEVLIAGFGRYGQIFGRILRAQNIPFVAIDHDPEQIELLRKFGNKVYYGDASRADLLETAGAARARFFVLAIDDVDDSMRAARTVLEQFPNLQILARARNRGHAFDLMEIGVKLIRRETFESSLAGAKDLLLGLGIDKGRARTMINHFRNHDEIMLVEQFKVRGDTRSMISVSKQANLQLAEVLRQDNLQTYIRPEGASGAEDRAEDRAEATP